MQTKSRIFTTTALAVGLLAPMTATGANAQPMTPTVVSVQEATHIQASPAISGIQVKGGIASRYYALGGERVFGHAITEERSVAGGVVQTFRSNTGKTTDFYWRSGTGAQPVAGGIKGAYDRLGGADRVGIPVTAERGVADGIVQSFRSTSGKTTDIYWKSGIGAYPVAGGIKSAYDRMGGATQIGHPISNEFSVAGGIVQSFKTSTGKITDIYWKSGVGTYAVTGGIRTELGRVGGVAQAGHPTSGEIRVSSSQVDQKFQNGVMTWLSGGRGASFRPYVSTPAPAPVEPAPAPIGTAETKRSGFITGYTYHSTDGSTAIAHSSAWNPNTIHTAVGGVGTYEDPITLATDPKIYKPGTRFYLPHVQRYFIVEDTCGACGGKDDRIDMWVGGSKADEEADTLKCAYAVTGTYDFIVNPKKGYPVKVGSLFNSTTDTCTTITK